MKSKFYEVYKAEYKKILKEDAPTPESAIEVEDVPEVGGNDENLEEIPEVSENEESQLPDPKEQETVSIDLLNYFIDFLNIPEEEREQFLRDHNFTSERADSNNYKAKVDALKSLAKNSFPEESF